MFCILLPLQNVSYLLLCQRLMAMPKQRLCFSETKMKTHVSDANTLFLHCLADFVYFWCSVSLLLGVRSVALSVEGYGESE